MEISDEVMVLNYGQPIAQGKPEEVQNHPEVLKAYLGEESAMGGGLMLQVKNIETLYGLVMALRGVSLELPEHKITAILGSNGAGKSTLCKTIMGMLEDQPDKGTIWLDDTRIDKKDTEDIVNLG